MPALQDQPYPSHPAAQRPWLRAQIQRQYRQLADILPAIPDSDVTSVVTWEILAQRVADVRDMAVELKRLQAS